jgi:poly(A) polymerase
VSAPQPLYEALAGLPWVFTGAEARARLGGARRGHAPLELVVEGSTEDVRARLPQAVPDGGALRADGVLVCPAPDGLEAGLRRRSVPLDALGVAPDGGVFDPLGGRAALRAGDLGFVASGHDAADALTGLRCCALVAEGASPPTAALMEALSDDAGRVLRAEREAVRELLTRLLMGRDPVAGLRALEQSRLLGFVLPEVAALIGLHRGSRYHHKDVWAHTCLVVRQAIPKATIRWAALLHDIGKPWTRTFAPPGQVHFFQHDELGAVMFEGIALRWRFPSVEADRIRTLVLHHLRANLYDRSWSDAAVRRFGQEMGPVFEDLMHLSRADVTSKRPGRRREAIANLYDLRQRVAAIRVADAARKPAVPKGLGIALIEALGVSPGPRVGELRRLCEDAVRRGELSDRPDIEACLTYLRTRGAA